MSRTEWNWRLAEPANQLAWGTAIIKVMVYSDRDIGDEDAHVDCHPMTLQRETHRGAPDCKAYPHPLGKDAIGWP